MPRKPMTLKSFPRKRSKLRRSNLASRSLLSALNPWQLTRNWLPSKGKLQYMDSKDRKRRAREEARNNVESFVYRTQDFLYDDIVELVSTEVQRVHLREQLSETSDWLYGDGEQAQTEDYIAKLKNLQKLEKPITFRRSEYKKRPETVKSLQSSISVARRFVESIRANTMEEDRYHTDEELDKLELVCDDAEDWLAAKQREQDKLALYVDPVLLTTDIESQAKVVERETMTLLMKKKPKKEKKKEKEEEGKTEEGKEEETKAQERKTAETKTQEGEEPETPVTERKEPKHNEL
ncbi:hypothetical protein BC936DRAFT_137265 [Jimgerdemannia flammicorona]|uniref:Uncharacterized protein n=1 Tax=Jimgerdemannia flammicorona TaxID=994334 RepID=A0A433CXR8_9FUNG|nr:hypothetical protein BC936DRAFT_137265 [Jimgerdemannia flammicorona]